MTGSNRRPPACKAGALPAELIPLLCRYALLLNTSHTHVCVALLRLALLGSESFRSFNERNARTKNGRSVVQSLWTSSTRREAPPHTSVCKVAEQQSNAKFRGGLAQLGEHLLCKQGVVGSIPSSSTNPLRGGSPGGRHLGEHA